MTRVAFLGMTHLGLNSAVATAVRGLDVIGLDPDVGRLKGLREGAPSIREPGLDDALIEQKDRLHFTDDPSVLETADLAVVAPDVPTDDAGQTDLTELKALIALADHHLPAERPLVLLSQLPPGFCRTLTLSPGRPLYYQVETLVFGQALERAVNPERIILGAKMPKAALHPVVETYLSAFECPLLPMRYESAELAKIAINCCLVAHISTANTLAELCEQIGADWHEITPALKLDRRIGQHAYLSPGLGIAGGNLERDLAAVVAMAAQHGTDARTVTAWQNNSRYRKDWVLRKLRTLNLPKKRRPVIGVWGLAYKKDTHSIKNSPSVALLSHILFCDIQAFDPVVEPATVDLALTPFDSALDAATGSDALLIMTPWDVFSETEAADLAGRMQGRILIDPYGVFRDQAEFQSHFDYHTLGRSTDA